jgi:hypothetical protein
MPYLQLDVPRHYPIEVKRRLAQRLSQIFADIMQITPDNATVAFHLPILPFTKGDDGTLVLPGVGKELVRSLHSEQRSKRLEQSTVFLARAFPKALPLFADGA